MSAQQDQQACEKEVSAALERYDCMLLGRAVIVPGAVDVQVLIVKKPKEQPATA